MGTKKTTVVLQALSALAPDETETATFVALREVAKKHQITPALALRLVQFRLANGYHDKLSSGHTDTQAKPVHYEICFGNACLKRGAREILVGLQTLAARQTSDPGQRPVKIKTCSCLHRCSKGPLVRVDGVLHEKFPIPE